MKLRLQFWPASCNSQQVRLNESVTNCRRTSAGELTESPPRSIRDMKIYDLIKDLLPRAVVTSLGRVLAREAEQIIFTGDYKSWEEAGKDSTSYDAPEILRKTRASLLKVKTGEAAFERDSITFDVMQHNFSLLSGL